MFQFMITEAARSEIESGLKHILHSDLYEVSDACNLVVTIGAGRIKKTDGDKWQNIWMVLYSPRHKISPDETQIINGLEVHFRIPSWEEFLQGKTLDFENMEYVLKDRDGNIVPCTLF